MVFLGILAEIPWIENAVVYEIYNHERKNRENPVLFVNY